MARHHPDLDTLIAEHGHGVSRTAALYERDAADRQDLVQDIWIAVWRALPAFRGDSSLRTYIFRIAHNCGVNHVARHARRDRPVADLPEEADAGPSPEQFAGRHQDAGRLESAIRRLAVKDRQIVGLKLEGFSNRDIAEASGLTENNVAVRLNRARGRLKQLLKDPA